MLCFLILLASVLCPSYRYNSRMQRMFARTTFLESPPSGFHQLRLVVPWDLRTRIKQELPSLTKDHCQCFQNVQRLLLATSQGTKTPKSHKGVQQIAILFGACFVPDRCLSLKKSREGEYQVYLAQPFTCSRSTAQSIVTKPTVRKRLWFAE